LSASAEIIEKSFMHSKALGHMLFQNLACNQLHLMWALILVKPLATGFIRMGLQLAPPRVGPYSGKAHGLGTLPTTIISYTCAKDLMKS